MKYMHFTVAADGFAGHLAEPEEKAAQAVIIVMGGEKGLLPEMEIIRWMEEGLCLLKSEI
jgi:hypothetical protein